MGKLVIFVLGIFVGVAATLALQYDAVERAQVVEPQLERVSEPQPVVEATQPPAPQPFNDAVAAAPLWPGLPEPLPLEDALNEAQGDFEALIVAKDTLIGGRATELLAGDEFSRLVSALSRSPSPNAAVHHQRLFEEFHGLASVRSGAVIVQALACGQRVCAASLVGFDSASIDQAWSELTGRPSEMGPQMRNSDGLEVSFRDEGIIGSLQTKGPNGMERRMVITADPAVRAFTSGYVVFDPENPPGGGR